MADDLASGGRKPPELQFTQGADAPRSPTILAPLLLFAFALFQALGTNNLRDFYHLPARRRTRGARREPVRRAEGPASTSRRNSRMRTRKSSSPTAAISCRRKRSCCSCRSRCCRGRPRRSLGPSRSASRAYFVARLPGMLRPKPSHSRLALVSRAVLAFAQPAVARGRGRRASTRSCSSACVAAGLLCFERGRPYLAAVLWAIPFVKPHLAIPLIPLAWYLGGWRPAALLVALVGVAQRRPARRWPAARRCSCASTSTTCRQRAKWWRTTASR